MHREACTRAHLLRSSANLCEHNGYGSSESQNAVLAPAEPIERRAIERRAMEDGDDDDMFILYFDDRLLT